MEMQTCGKPVDTLMERVLSMNILASDYFRGLFRLKTYHEVIDEIYYQVSHVEPWMTGNCRGPSTAFCLLYKFFTMKLTVKQVQGLITHEDSPYIRAVSQPHHACASLVSSVQFRPCRLFSCSLPRFCVCVCVNLIPQVLLLYVRAVEAVSCGSYVSNQVFG
ncbi:hypothetical protein CLOM_g14492 [Closterium sp. NIES-68]|nr:hypothetical protein CLOM_g14492 [Closterium sp. NIES-68]